MTDRTRDTRQRLPDDVLQEAYKAWVRDRLWQEPEDRHFGEFARLALEDAGYRLSPRHPYGDSLSGQAIPDRSGQ